MTEPPDKDFYKTIKVPLKHIIKNFEINQPKINDLTIMAHKIVIHTLQFMKMYLKSCMLILSLNLVQKLITVFRL